MCVRVCVSIDPWTTVCMCMRVHLTGQQVPRGCNKSSAFREKSARACAVLGPRLTRLPPLRSGTPPPPLPAFPPHHTPRSAPRIKRSAATPQASLLPLSASRLLHPSAYPAANTCQNIHRHPNRWDPINPPVTSKTVYLTRAILSSSYAFTDSHTLAIDPEMLLPPCSCMYATRLHPSLAIDFG